MPEVFQNTFTFENASSVPPAEKLHDALAAQFKTTLNLTIHPLGEHGALRAYATMETTGLQIWAYWEPQRPEIELTIDTPMSRMITANAAMLSLGGKPRYVDQSWRLRHRSRVYARLRKLFALLLAIAIAIATIHALHWWGLLLVILTLASLTFLYILFLARSFRH